MSTPDLQGGADVEKKQQEAEAKRRMMLNSLMTPEARERLDRIAIVNQSKARAVGDAILSRASQGLVASKIDENQLKRMLDESSKSEGSSGGKVLIQRKKYQDDDDDDNDDDL